MGLQASIGGDTRYDQVVYRLNNPKPLPAALQNRLPNNPDKILVMGSTWPEDEQALIEFIVGATKDQGFTFLIAPHEPSESHLSSLESLLKNHNLRVGRLSQWEQTETAVPQVLLIDRVGILAELYTLGRWAFVGGSFRKTVHSVMEPLAAGARTLVGPLHRNNAEAIEFQSPELNSVHCVASSADARKALSATWPSPAHIQLEVRVRAGATKKLVDDVLPVRNSK
jgi:3-deoxy-D-manno-octulosonic-acid transferase